VDDIASLKQRLVKRREFLKSSAIGSAGLAFAGLAGKAARAAMLPYSPDYGPLFPTRVPPTRR